jgi:large subunit ribosomal protein L10
VRALADLPAIDELRAKLVGLLATPAARLIGVLQAPGAQLARVLAARAEQS